MSAEQPAKQARTRRIRRRENGMAETAGITRAPREESLMRTLTMLNAALRVWEAKNGHQQFRSVWARRSQQA
jgi:hypothetical protein